MSDDTADFDIEIGCLLDLPDDRRLVCIDKSARQRKPSISRMIRQAEKSGHRVTSITTPDGTTINFGDPEPSETNNPWRADLRVTKQ